jgi:cytoplasmic iron level regulating protein YaaA (DUF328/UPF0246 family)
MLITISPAKTLDFSQQGACQDHSTPDFLKESRELIKATRKLSPEELGELMGISQKLALLNYQRYRQWKTPFTPDNAKQALLAFRGDVYEGMSAQNFSSSDLAFAQEHLRILSGLYGVLRPLDLIQPYRLEMGTRLKTTRGNDLYQFWGDKITKSLNADLEQQGGLLINLASNEYFKSVVGKKLAARIITPEFKDAKAGHYKVISFYAKKARGLMSAFIIKNRLQDPEEIKAFDERGYSYNEGLSSPDKWVFTREENWTAKPS